jgi:Zn-dependent peptidase ImmA (M78 family)
LAPRVAETAARQLLHGAGISAPPVDLERIVGFLHLVVAVEPLQDDVSGMLLRRGEWAVIAVNRSQHARRRRFTIAHEIGHFMLHKGVYIDKDTRINQRGSRSRSGLDTDEVQANAFAAELLMPTDLLIREFNGRVRMGSRGVPAIVGSLADLFDVSTQAMEIRLKVIGALAPF